MNLDETHYRMIDLLRADGRISVAAMAERLGISRSNAYNRYEALQREGVITGVHARIDPAKVGLGVAAMVFVSLRQSQWSDFRLRLDTVAELEYFAVMTGEHDAMMLVRGRDVAAIHALVVDELAQWPSIKATETVFIMHELRAPPALGRVETAGAGGSEDPEQFGMTRFVRTSDDRAKRQPERRRR